MTMAPPMKPPRGVKQSKETSGLLMSVIRTLSASESNEQRDREKANLEKEYKRSDKKLDELVSVHDKSLTQVMQLFGKLSTQVTASRERLHSVKENLQACKMLLRCRRDELKKLWLEGVEHKQVLQLLEEIDHLREVPSQLSAFLSKKHYLHATQLLVSALSLGDGSLEGVEALREVRTDLQAKKQQLHCKLLEELKRHIYIVSTQEVLALRRQSSGRDYALNSPFQRAGELRNSARGLKVRRALMEAPPPFLGTPSRPILVASDSEMDQLCEDIDGSEPEADSERFMSILVECLALLHKVPDAIESLKVQMQPELLSIMSRTTQQVIEISQSQQGQSQQGQLVELLFTLFEQFRRVAAAHMVVLRSLANVSTKYNIDVRLYEMADVWSKVQAVLQLLLTDYLDIQNVATDSKPAPATFSDQASDISAFFAKKKPQRPKKALLFKFDSSSNALSINSYLKECKEDGVPQMLGGAKSRAAGRQRVLVCAADARNITVILTPLMRFVEEIEQAIGGKAAPSPCALNAFLADYVREVFLGRLLVMVTETIETATRSSHAWRTTTGPDEMQTLGVSRPVLQSTVTVEKCVKDLRELMHTLPVYAENFLTIICNILGRYRESCLGAYKEIIQPESEEKRICSAAWLKDEDISRFIKSLPNWMDLQAQKVTNKRRGLRREETADEESPEDVRQRNMREAEILASNLGEGGINAHEIISNVQLLKGLAILQESLEWFSMSILMFASQVPRLSPKTPTISGQSEGIPPMPEATVQALTNLGQEFEELANTCLLVLHLEVRVQCFHYLRPRGNNYSRFIIGGSDSQEPDPKVLELSRVLVNIDEAMNSSLQPRKSKYIFEGLGHLIAKILISAAQFIERLDEGGIQKMCRNIFALQQTLTNITMTREVALDHARHYFELFYHTPEEILGGLMEKGPEFSELEYMNAFQLVHRSQSNHPEQEAINTHLSRLSDILGEVGVTV